MCHWAGHRLPSLLPRNKSRVSDKRPSSTTLATLARAVNVDKASQRFTDFQSHQTKILAQHFGQHPCVYSQIIPKR
ncbi:hypothetical protein CDEST_06712 [Colletotrichum destructivum]|uniref:Uncharacterized protein n=1 Tax=Colletotrichum destructivum TaxID=34406 RepID=A0AAX4IFX4_9PEZI|nr:hypothetical protein CDEST_06712 [Colletotrichum destructivum]